MSPNSALRSFLLAAGSSLLAISYAHAADGTWDTNSGGNWTDVTKWLGDTAYASGADFTATFGNFISADSIINLDANITIGNITASDTTHNYTISGANILTLDRTSPDVPVIDVTTSSRTLTISSELSGSDGLQKNGAGTLVLGSTTSSSLSGNINIAAGALSARFSALGSGNLVFTGNSSFTKLYNTPGTATTGFTVNDGVTATIGGSTFYYNFTTTGALVGNNTAKLVISSGGNTDKSFNSTSNTFSGELTLGGGGTADNGQRTGFKSLADSSQKIIINDALFRLNNGGVSMNFANRVLEMTGNARLDNDSTSSSVTLSFAQDLSVKTGNNARLLTLSGVNTGDNTFSGVIGNSSTGTGKVSVTKSEAGTWILGGANTYTGVTTVSGGTLILGVDDCLADTSNVAIGAGTLNAADSVNDTAGTLDVTNAASKINLGSGATLAFANSSGVTLGVWAGALDILGTFVPGNDVDPGLGVNPGSLRFGVDNTGLTASQLADISVNGSGAGTYTLDAFGYLKAGGGGPGPVDHFAISAIASLQTVGTPITGITLTAQDASNNTATSFIGTVNFGGTGGFTGTSATFTAGVLSGVSVIPTNAGSGLTFTVTDIGTGKTGSATITTIQTQYEAWAGGALFGDDANGDGVDNGLGFLLGASGPSAAVTLPVVTQSAGNLVLSNFLSRNDASRGTATLSVQHSSDLGITDPWVSAPVTDAGTAASGVTFSVTPGSPNNTVTATISVSEAAASKLFGRLKATP